MENPVWSKEIWANLGRYRFVSIPIGAVVDCYILAPEVREYGWSNWLELSNVAIVL